MKSGGQWNPIVQVSSYGPLSTLVLQIPNLEYHVMRKYRANAAQISVYNPSKKMLFFPTTAN